MKYQGVKPRDSVPRELFSRFIFIVESMRARMQNSLASRACDTGVQSDGASMEPTLETQCFYAATTFKSSYVEINGALSRASDSYDDAHENAGSTKRKERREGAKQR